MRNLDFSRVVVAVAIAVQIQGMASSAMSDEVAPDTVVTLPESQKPLTKEVPKSTQNNSSTSAPTTSRESLKKILPGGEKSKPEKRKVTASLLIDTASTLQPGASGSEGEGYSQSGLYRLDVGIPLPGDLTASLRGGYSQEYSYVKADGTSGGFTDSRAMLTKTWGEIVKDLKLSSSISLGLPTSKESRKSGLKSAAGIRSTINYKISFVEIEVTPIFSQNFHDTEIDLSGKVLTERSVTILSDLVLYFTEKLTLDFSFWPTRGWTYQGTTHDRYVSGVSLGYDFADAFSASIGVTTDASTLKSNGIESNYTLFDSYQTTGFLDLVVRL